MTFVTTGLSLSMVSSDPVHRDTESLLLEKLTEDLYKDMERSLKEDYDTSDYLRYHHLHYIGNKKVLGKM